MGYSKLSTKKLLRMSEEPDNAHETALHLDERQEIRRELRRRGVDQTTIDQASVGEFDKDPDPSNAMVTVTLGGSETQLPAYLADFMRRNGDL